jgi:hypothetical protein
MDRGVSASLFTSSGEKLDPKSWEEAGRRGRRSRPRQTIRKVEERIDAGGQAV